MEREIEDSVAAGIVSNDIKDDRAACQKNPAVCRWLVVLKLILVWSSRVTMMAVEITDQMARSVEIRSELFLTTSSSRGCHTKHADCTTDSVCY